MHIADLPQVRHLVALDQLLLQVFYLRIAAVDPVQAYLVRYDAPLLYLVDDHLQNRRNLGRIGQHIVVDLALGGEVKRRIAGSLQHVFALGVNNEIALAALHHHLAELGALVTVGAQFTIQNHLGLEQVRTLVFSGQGNSTACREVLRY